MSYSPARGAVVEAASTCCRAAIGAGGDWRAVGLYPLGQLTITSIAPATESAAIQQDALGQMGYGLGDSLYYY